MIAASDPLRFLLALVAFAIAALLLIVIIGILYLTGTSFVAAMQEIDRKRSGHPPEAARRTQPALTGPSSVAEHQAGERRFIAAEAAKAAADEQADWYWRRADTPPCTFIPTTAQGHPQRMPPRFRGPNETLAFPHRADGTCS